MLLMGRTLQEILMARHIDFSNTTFEFYDQPRKISPSPVKQIEFLGLTIDTKKTTFRSIREKIKACVSTISGDFHAAKNFSPKSHKVNWPAAINCPNLFANRNLVSISSEKTNISSTEKGILKWSCDSE